MRRQQISSWVDTLSKSFRVQPHVDEAPLQQLHAAGNYAGMLCLIKKHLLLDETKLRVGYVNSGGLSDAPAWVEIPENTPMFGTQSFRSHTFTMYVRKEVIQTFPFGTLSILFAHELSHIVLSSTKHSLHLQEEAVDLTAMLLGYRRMYVKYGGFEQESVLGSFLNPLLQRFGLGRLDPETESQLGYLSQEERAYASHLMDAL